MTEGAASPVQVGVVMLVHAAFDRAAQLVRHWAGAGCPVVVHVDAAVPDEAVLALGAALADLGDRVAFSARHRCEWGTWGLVAATLEASRLLLDRHPGVTHAFLASGSCLPLRPVASLRDYLAARPGTDFIESATTADVPWTVGGLSEERFTLRFPFSWRRHRRLFDWYVEFQRRWGIRRRIPAGIVPHMGSQWWCLTRATLSAILDDPERGRIDRYFQRVWIPDESYFQTMARRHRGTSGTRIESRSLTLSKFDFQGKPHIFYDDHLQLLRRSDCFVARKAWARADRLWDAFLGANAEGVAAEPSPGKIDRVFAQATERRTRGRAGLWMQGRFPREGWENGVTAGPYAVFEGFSELYEDWEPWLRRQLGSQGAVQGPPSGAPPGAPQGPSQGAPQGAVAGARVHGHLFAPHGAEFEGGQECFAGALPSGAALRDRMGPMFLRNLVWTMRGERQVFQFGPGDAQAPSWDIAKDPNAQVAVVSGAWIVPMFRRPPSDLRGEAARLQRIEAEHLAALRSPYAKARVRVWTMADFLEAPGEALRMVLEDLGAARATRPEPPRMADLTGFGRFLQDLKNEGMHPYLMGDFPAEGPPPGARAARQRRPYLVR